MSDRRVRFIRGNDQEERQAILRALDERTVRIELPAGSVSHDHQLLALAVTDLLGRLFPRISIACDEGIEASPGLPPGSGSLRERLEQVRHHGIGPEEPDEPALTLGIGTDDDADLYADGTSWQSYLGTQPSQLDHGGDNGNPIGALAAASRVCAHAFRQMLSDFLGEHEVPVSVYSSALGFSNSDKPIEIVDLISATQIEAVLVGAGSVGGATVYALARVRGLYGSLAVVDPQRLEPKNPDRALLATPIAANANEPKADVAADALEGQRPALRVEAYQQTVAEFVAGRDREEPLPLMMCAVDSVEARRSLQDCLPLRVINAACNPDEATVSSHVTGAGACTCCLHMADVLNEEQVRWRLISAATGWNRDRVVAYLIGNLPLQKSDLRSIEQHRGLNAGTLESYENDSLDDLWRAELLYGEARFETVSGLAVAVAAPWVTSLAGFLLAAEVLKTFAGLDGGDLLGPHADSPGVQWQENLYASPQHGLLGRPQRWVGNECLCRSARRRRLTIARYGLDEGDYPP